jgi:tetratricopeptide (TPR) repeat protein
VCRWPVPPPDGGDTGLTLVSDLANDGKQCRRSPRRLLRGLHRERSARAVWPGPAAAGALVALVSGRDDRAEQLCALALGTAASPDEELAAKAAVVHWILAFRTGEQSQALEHLERAVRCFRRCGAAHQAVRNLGVMAAVKSNSGDLAAAADAAREALTLARHTGNPGLISSALAGLAYVLANTDPQRSRTLIAESSELNDQPGGHLPDELAVVSTITAPAILAEREDVLRRSAGALNGVLTGITGLAPCLEATAEALAPRHRLPPPCSTGTSTRSPLTSRSANRTPRSADGPCSPSTPGSTAITSPSCVRAAPR